MKTNTLLVLASLAVLATSASAASSPTVSDVVVLPTLVVKAPRYLPLEERINASLNELRQRARVPVTLAAEPTALEAQVKLDARAAQDARGTRVAKL
jgi:hypothetical protein